MNIAISTFILLYVLLPGITFTLLFNYDPVTNTRLKTNLTSLITHSILPSFIIHLVGTAVIKLFSLEISFKIIGYLVYGTKKDELLRGAFENIQNNFLNIFFYLIGTLFFSAFAAKFFLKVIWLYRLDEKLGFKINTPWYYVGTMERKKKADFYYVDALTEISGELILYSGMLVDYKYYQDQLESIVLSSAKRKFISKPLIEEEPKGTDFKGSVGIEVELGKLTTLSRDIIIKYDSIKNLTVAGFIIEKISASELTVEEKENALDLTQDEG